MQTMNKHIDEFHFIFMAIGPKGSKKSVNSYTTIFSESWPQDGFNKRVIPE
jgi:hypothetical protein